MLRAALAVLLPIAMLQAQTTGMLSRTFAWRGTTHRYLLFVPPEFDRARPWPLILSLHGAGECGGDGFAQAAVGLGTAVLHRVSDWPFLILLPQKPAVSDAWEDHEAWLLALLAQVRSEFPVAGSAMFLTGLSQGGHGTWVLGARHPELFAAIAPVCGYGDPKAIAPDLAKTPVWAFHGDADKAVPVQQSRDLTDAVRAAGGTPLLTVYPGVGHNSWDRAYRDEGLSAWFLAAARDRALADQIAGRTPVTQGQVTVSCMAGEATSTLDFVLAAGRLECVRSAPPQAETRTSAEDGPARFRQVLRLVELLRARPAARADAADAVRIQGRIEHTAWPESVVSAEPALLARLRALAGK